MRYKDIDRHLKPYSIKRKRTTTINHAFAAAIAPCDAYHEETVRQAIVLLGQNPDDDLVCVYCGEKAETWDHVHATVRDKKFSGHGHRIGNLLPCCKPCNFRKGGKHWEKFLPLVCSSETDLLSRRNGIAAYLAKLFVKDSIPENVPEYQRLQEIRKQILELFEEADKLADIIRDSAPRT